MYSKQLFCTHKQTPIFAFYNNPSTWLNQEIWKNNFDINQQIQQQNNLSHPNSSLKEYISHYRWVCQYHQIDRNWHTIWFFIAHTWKVFPYLRLINYFSIVDISWSRSFHYFLLLIISWRLCLALEMVRFLMLVFWMLIIFYWCFADLFHLVLRIECCQDIMELASQSLRIQHCALFRILCLI